jgi:hypothetical protein
MERKIGDPRHFLISDAHKGVVIDKKPKRKTNQTPKKKKRK